MNAVFRNNWSLVLNPLAVRWGRRSVTALRGGPALRENAWRNSFGSLSTDSRRALTFNLWANAAGVFGTSERFGSVGPWVDFRPGGSLSLSLGADYSWARNPTQWVTRRVVADSAHYVLGDIDRETLNVSARLDWTFSPTMSFQLYAQPFVSAGAYDDFKDVADPKADAFENRFRAYGQGAVCRGASCEVDLDADGAPDFSFGRPDFTFRSLRSTAVMRWEYRPGSVLYVVWQHGRSESVSRGTLRGMEDLRDLFSLASDNTLLVKANYWLSF